jgi:hypothetical protein
MKNQEKSNSKNSVEVLFSDLERVRENLRIAKDAEKSLVAEITSLYDLSMREAYIEKGDKFGTVHVEDGEFKITFVTPKKVSWDQNGLARLWQEGAPVSIEYGLSETLYKTLDQVSQAEFMPYRTVTPGKTTIEIERVK